MDMHAHIMLIASNLAQRIADCRGYRGIAITECLKIRTGNLKCPRATDLNLRGVTLAVQCDINGLPRGHISRVAADGQWLRGFSLIDQVVAGNDVNGNGITRSIHLNGFVGAGAVTGLIADARRNVQRAAWQ